MKNRQKFTVSEKNLLRKSESDANSSVKPRRKNSSNTLLQKNLQFLQTYNKIFRRPSCNQFGDADTYFRQTLRNDPLNLIRDLDLNHLVRPTKSVEELGKRKPRSHRTLLSPKRNVEPEQPRYIPRRPLSEEGSLHLKELFSNRIDSGSSDSDSETENKDYFSPKTEPLLGLEEVEEVSEEETTARPEFFEVSYRLDDIEKEENTGIMAEDEDVVLDEMEDKGEEDNDITVGDEEYNETANENEYEGVVEEEDDEMKEVEMMIERASKELQQVVDENKELMESLKEEEIAEIVNAEENKDETNKDETNKDETSKDETNKDENVGGQSGDAPPSKFDPTIDLAVIKELEAAENEAKETAKIIEELKQRVTELSKKEKMTEAEAKELENKNQELKAHMAVFEEKTKRIQQLIGQAILFGDVPFGKTPGVPQIKHNEDALPKVVVCGLTENNIPKILICDDKKKKRCTPKTTGRKQDSPRTEIAKKLNECYCMQEKLAAENADLEGKRYKLQADIVNQDQTVEYLQRQLATLQADMRMICQENTLLNQKLQNCPANPCGANRSRSSSPEQKKKMPCGKSKGICPADIEYRLKEYSENTEHLEKQLEDMECEVKAMQKELIGVQKEREHLEHHRKMLCRPPCVAPHPCMPPPCMPPPCEQKSTSSDTQLRELREQYSRLQDDFKSKLTEVAGLRADNEKLKEKTKLAEETKKAAEDKLKELENEIKIMKGKGIKGSGTREQLIEMEQQLKVAKQRFREAQDELEELRSLVEDQQTQLDDYRNKYLEAQQTVEEQRRQADLMEMENQRISEQVNLEIQRVKNQFQEKLQELMPLPDILKSTQMKLQEAQQMHLLAERNNEAIARELQMYKDKITAMNNQLNEVRSDQQLGEDAKVSLATKISDLENRLEEVLQENQQLKSDLEALTEKAEDFERTAEERLHEITQLESQLSNLREETARQVARTKDRCEIVRRSMQNQISDLERQLAQSRALAKAAQKDRDDIRQKMQSQINNLNENFEDAQMRIRNLQGHVNFLKNTYGNVYPEKPEVPPSALPDPCSCSANY